MTKHMVGNVVVNDGDLASATDAEVFGAAAVRISQDEYHLAPCEMADQISGCASA